MSALLVRSEKMCSCILSLDQYRMIARLNVGTTWKISKMCLNALGVKGSFFLCVRLFLKVFVFKKNSL